jgi:competence protein ComEA
MIEPRSFRFNICVILISAVFSASCTAGYVADAPHSGPIATSENAVNINTASAEELAKIPHIGPKLAGEIVGFRDRHGRFRRTEHLMLIRGISDSRYREIRAFVKAD